ncbi:MAG: hypothetical protein K2X47_14300 [Bdellovibrionales bacterium]|nr:hypothetical protein [Bdellovibrionales bacterium]
MRHFRLLFHVFTMCGILHGSASFAISPRCSLPEPILTCAGTGGIGGLGPEGTQYGLKCRGLETGKISASVGRGVGDEAFTKLRLMALLENAGERIVLAPITLKPELVSDKKSKKKIAVISVDLPNAVASVPRGGAYKVEGDSETVFQERRLAVLKSKLENVISLTKNKSVVGIGPEVLNQLIALSYNGVPISDFWLEFEISSSFVNGCKSFESSDF